MFIYSLSLVVYITRLSAILPEIFLHSVIIFIHILQYGKYCTSAGLDLITMPTTASRTEREKASSSMRVGPPRGSASTSALRASTTCSSVQTETSSCSICRSTTSRLSVCLSVSLSVCESVCL